MSLASYASKSVAESRPQLNDSLCVGEAENAGGCAICVNVVLKNLVFFAFSSVLLSVL